MKRPNPTPDKPLVSPRLVRHPCGDLDIARSGQAAICCEYLEQAYVIPDAASYWIEVSATQWPGRSGTAVWVKWAGDGRWLWSYDSHAIVEGFLHKAERFITRHLKPSRDKPTQYFFRLVYED